MFHVPLNLASKVLHEFMYCTIICFTVGSKKYAEIIYVHKQKSRQKKKETELLKPAIPTFKGVVQVTSESIAMIIS